MRLQNVTRAQPHAFKNLMNAKRSRKKNKRNKNKNKRNSKLKNRRKMLMIIQLQHMNHSGTTA